MSFANPYRAISRRDFRYLVVFVYVFARISGIAQPFVEIRAELELAAYQEDNTNSQAKLTPQTFSVVCLAGTNEWRVEEGWVQNSVQSWFFDGTNVYNGSRTTRPMSKDMEAKIASITPHLAMVPFEQARSNLTIRVWPSIDGHPLGNPVVNITWLAFCSGTYLKRDGRLIPLPLDELHHTCDRFAYTDKTQTFGDNFGLPRQIDLFLSKSLFVVSEDDFDKEVFFGNRYTQYTKKRAESLPDGAHTFHYEVTETTNLFGWDFPLKFQFFQKGRSFEQNGDWFWRGSGRVTSIGPSTKPEGVFIPSMQQTIVDARFHDPVTSVGAIIYQTTNAFLMATNDPVLQERFAKQVRQVELHSRKGNN
jgi:hypothetical protein